MSRPRLVERFFDRNVHASNVPCFRPNIHALLLRF